MMQLEPQLKQMVTEAKAAPPAAAGSVATCDKASPDCGAVPTKGKTKSKSAAGQVAAPLWVRVTAAGAAMLLAAALLI